MPNRKVFLPKKETLLKFINEVSIPDGFLYGDNDEDNVALVVAQILKYHPEINFMESFSKAYQDMADKNLAIKYYTPQLYKKMLNISNDEWNIIIHSDTGLTLLQNLALSETLSTSLFDEGVKQGVKALTVANDCYVDTGIINLDHLKTLT